MVSTGLFYHQRFLDHLTGELHPERPERVSAIVGHLRSAGLLSQLECPKFEPADKATLCLVHLAEYVRLVERACPDEGLFYFEPDTPVSRDSYEVARLAAGAVTAACERVTRGELGNAFCCVRPPGHHAEGARAMGFCLFNNVAIGARYLQGEGLARIAIVDWDVHHGNGTQKAFYGDPGVLYLSVHQFPHYPGSGSTEETGEGEGSGFTVNVPVPPGAGEREYEEIFDRVFAARIREFKPEFILVSAGFDAHRQDPLSAVDLSEASFGALTRKVKSWSEELCGGRLVLVLEGGYDLKALSLSVEACLRVMMG